MRLNLPRLAIALAACLSAAPDARALDLTMASDTEIGNPNWTGVMINPYFGYETLKLNGPGAGYLRSPNGWRVGSAVGYDYQIPGSPIVVGTAAEAFFAWYEGGEKNVSGVKGRVYDFGDIRGRLGYAFGRFLVYGTGGYAYSDFEIKNTHAGTSDRQILNGWTAGVGIEWVYNKTFTLRGELDHTSYGSANFSSLPGQSSLSATLDAFKIEVVTRF